MSFLARGLECGESRAPSSRWDVGGFFFPSMVWNAENRAVIGLEERGNEMHIDNDGFAACPSCGAPMRFPRTISLINDAAEMRIFECKPCRLVITAEHLLQVPELADAKPLVA